MTKTKKPSYYRLGNKYVACNRSARRMFEKKKIEYIDVKAVLGMKSIADIKKKGVTIEKINTTKKENK